MDVAAYFARLGERAYILNTHNVADHLFNVQSQSSNNVRTHCRTTRLNQYKSGQHKAIGHAQHFNNCNDTSKCFGHISQRNTNHHTRIEYHRTKRQRARPPLNRHSNNNSNNNDRRYREVGGVALDYELDVHILFVELLLLALLLRQVQDLVLLALERVVLSEVSTTKR